MITCFVINTISKTEFRNNLNAGCIILHFYLVYLLVFLFQTIEHLLNISNWKEELVSLFLIRLQHAWTHISDDSQQNYTIIFNQEWTLYRTERQHSKCFLLQYGTLNPEPKQNTEEQYKGRAAIISPCHVLGNVSFVCVISSIGATVIIC